MREKRRLWEGAKTLLIVLLACSAVYLAARTLFPWQLTRILPHPVQTGVGEGAPSEFSSQTLRPAALSVTAEDKRYALLYHQDDQEVYTRVSAILAEALGDAAAPQQIARRSWEQALLSPGLYCEYLAPMPLDTLSLWLSGQKNAQLSGTWAQRLCVTGEALNYQSRSGEYYACALSPDLSQALADLAAPLSSNGARFAGETENYGHLRWDTPVLAVTPSMPQLLAEDPISVSDAGAPGESLAQVLHALSFHPQTNSLYAIPGGWAINDGGEALRIETAGSLTYRRAEGESPHFTLNGDPLDATRALAEATVGSLCGDARLYLREVRQENGGTVITYGYAYRGASIQLGGEGWCAQFTVRDGTVEALALKPRRYTALTSYPAVLLPQEQAAAALPGPEEQALELLYADDGQSQNLTPFWAVRAEGR